MNAKPFLDTNVVLYAFREGDSRSQEAEALLGKGGLISVQVLNEFAAVARRKLNKGWEEVRRALSILRVLCPEAAPLLSRACPSYRQDARNCLADCPTLQVFNL